MRTGLLILSLCLIVFVGACRQAKIAGLGVRTSNFATLSFASMAKKPDFETQIKPISPHPHGQH
jgi:hypothetical protein